MGFVLKDDTICGPNFCPDLLLFGCDFLCLFWEFLACFFLEYVFMTAFPIYFHHQPTFILNVEISDDPFLSHKPVFLTTHTQAGQRDHW